MRALLLLLVALGLPAASAQPINFDWNTSDVADTEGWTYVAAAGEGAAEAVEAFANGPGTPSEGTRSLEAGPRGADTTHPLTNEFRGARVAYDPAIDLSTATDVSYQFNIYGSSPQSAVFEQRFQVVDGSGNTSEFASNVTKNSWNAVSFMFSDLTGSADLTDIVEISVQGRNPDGRGSDTFDPWGGRIQVDAFSITRPAVSNERGPGLAYLGEAYPNPAVAGATLDVEVETPQTVTAIVYDVLGRSVATAFDAALAPGERTAIRLDLESLPSGRYLVRVEGETFASSRVLTVVR